jgi:Helix-turn-helix domain
MSDELLKTREVAAILRVEMETVLDAYHRGDLPGFRLWGERGPLRFRRSAIEAFVAYGPNGGGDERRDGDRLGTTTRDAPADGRNAPGADTGKDTSDAFRTLRPRRRRRET